ncbi:MAG: alanine racemase [Parasporobacterium sp.]|nr:alanine racemase [Parasporobacterium sp.]
MVDCYRSWAEINLSAIEENILNLKAGLNEGVKSCAVIKADAYGHGAVRVGRYIEPIVDFFAVATLDEAIELRENGIEKPIMILGYIHPKFTAEAVSRDIRMTVFDFETAKAISDTLKAANASMPDDLALTAKIHIKVNTGMNRIGFYPNGESADIIKNISELPFIETEGIFTHFYASDEEKSSVDKQYKIFTDFIAELESRGVKFSVKHCSNSAASTLRKDVNMDMVRLGISIYGLYPSDYVVQLPLKPAMSWKAHITMVKAVKAGETIGYSATYTTERDSVIATVPVGYADGYRRQLSNCGWALVNGRKAPVVGRVCMDQIMIDVTDIPYVTQNSEVVLVGESVNALTGEKATVTLEELAPLTGTINYDIACGVSKRIPRVYVSHRSED